MYTIVRNPLCLLWKHYDYQAYTNRDQIITNSPPSTKSCLSRICSSLYPLLSLYTLFSTKTKRWVRKQNKEWRIFWWKRSLSMSFNCHLLLMSSSITNGWTLGRAIIEENSRHYNSLVCPFALCPYSSCFISTTFLLLLHDTSSPSNCTPRCYAQFCPVFIQRSIVKICQK